MEIVNYFSDNETHILSHFVIGLVKIVVETLITSILIHVAVDTFSFNTHCRCDGRLLWTW